MKKLETILVRNKLFYHYKFQLTEIVRGVFNFENLPQSLLADELLKNIINHGYSVVGYAFSGGKNVGLKVLDNATIGGVTEYDDRFSFSVYSNPINDSKTYYVDSEKDDKCVIVRANSCYLKLSKIIDKYSVLLSDADITTDMALISLRASNVLCGSSNNSYEKKSIEDFFKNLIDGKLSHILTEKMTGGVTSVELRGGNNNDMTACTIVKNNIMRQFYRELGISVSKDKTQAILSDEVESDNQFLKVNQESLFRWIKIGVSEINEKFDTSISVTINPVYTIVDSNDSRESFEEREG